MESHSSSKSVTVVTPGMQGRLLRSLLTPTETDLQDKAARRRGRFVIKLAAALFLMECDEADFPDPGSLSNGMAALWSHTAVGEESLRRHRWGCRSPSRLLAAEGAWKAELGWLVVTPVADGGGFAACNKELTSYFQHSIKQHLKERRSLANASPACGGDASEKALRHDGNHPTNSGTSLPSVLTAPERNPPACPPPPPDVRTTLTELNLLFSWTLKVLRVWCAARAPVDVSLNEHDATRIAEGWMSLRELLLYLRPMMSGHCGSGAASSPKSQSLFKWLLTTQDDVAMAALALVLTRLDYLNKIQYAEEDTIHPARHTSSCSSFSSSPHSLQSTPRDDSGTTSTPAPPKGQKQQVSCDAGGYLRASWTHSDATVAANVLKTYPRVLLRHLLADTYDDEAADGADGCDGKPEAAMESRLRTFCFYDVAEHVPQWQGELNKFGGRLCPVFRPFLLMVPQSVVSRIAHGADRTDAPFGLLSLRGPAREEAVAVLAEAAPPSVWREAALECSGLGNTCALAAIDPHFLEELSSTPVAVVSAQLEGNSSLRPRQASGAPFVLLVGASPSGWPPCAVQPATAPKDWVIPTRALYALQAQTALAPALSVSSPNAATGPASSKVSILALARVENGLPPQGVLSLPTSGRSGSTETGVFVATVLTVKATVPAGTPSASGSSLSTFATTPAPSLAVSSTVPHSLPPSAPTAVSSGDAATRVGTDLAVSSSPANSTAVASSATAQSTVTQSYPLGAAEGCLRELARRHEAQVRQKISAWLDVCPALVEKATSPVRTTSTEENSTTQELHRRYEGIWRGLRDWASELQSACKTTSYSLLLPPTTLSVSAIREEGQAGGDNGTASPPQPLFLGQKKAVATLRRLLLTDPALRTLSLDQEVVLSLAPDQASPPPSWYVRRTCAEAKQPASTLPFKASTLAARLAGSQAVACDAEQNGRYSLWTEPVLLTHGDGITDTATTITPESYPLQLHRTTGKHWEATVAVVVGATADSPSSNAAARPQDLTEVLGDEWMLSGTWPADCIVDSLLIPPFRHLLSLALAFHPMQPPRDNDHWDGATVMDTAVEETRDVVLRDLRELFYAALTEPAQMERLEFVGDAVADYWVSLRLLSACTEDGVPLWQHGAITSDTTNRTLSAWAPAVVKDYFVAFNKVSNQKRRADVVEALVGALAVALWVRPRRRSWTPRFSLLLLCYGALQRILLGHRSESRGGGGGSNGEGHEGSSSAYPPPWKWQHEDIPEQI